MADRVHAFAPVVPAGTAIGAPVTVATPFPDGVVTAIQVRIPNGPLGTMGFVIAYAGQTIVPDNSGTWLVMNDEQWEWPLDNNPTGGQWSIIGYNTDIFDHTVYIRYLVNEFKVPVSSGSVIAPIPLGG